MDELVDALKKLGAQVSERIFKNPTKDETVGLYCLAIQEVFGRAITQVRYEEAMGTLKSNPKSDLFETFGFTIESNSYKSIGDLRFYRYCQRLHSALGLEPINPTTISNPTSADIKKFGKALLAFLKFRDNVLQLLGTDLDTLIQSLDVKFALINDSNQAVRELSEFSRCNEKNVHVILNMQQEKKCLETKLTLINEEFTMFKERLRTVNTRINELQESIEQILLQTVVARQTNQDLQDQVVEDPDKFKSDLMQYNSQIDSGNLELDHLKKSEEKLHEKIANFQNSKSRIDTTINLILSHLDNVIYPYSELISSITSATADSQAIDDDLKRINLEINDCHETLKCCKLDQDNMQRNMSLLENKLADNTKRLSMMDETGRERIESVHKRIKEKEEACLELEREIKKLEILKLAKDTNFNNCIQDFVTLLHPYEKLLRYY
ncbi:conserved Plasmodium protein, unknown function [Babesia microti strain RI]|uniref:Kinetochore protein Nuf2 N-terminal domain-containing protein n=1 Tax=Babesia microti (strain RI) TaxID=1133968 RepID=I7IPD8_BABMR|nr:conserved Plasmodium protein, unknown function [Babesia microti strain RI]CCF72875.1 conserved Plasmodium protein, unknown function [Babesia microti strain RI]|eukprot:XP_012647484.1 conserved Plasmodium protein, unknown function [Babesia microti strain RI]